MVQTNKTFCLKTQKIFKSLVNRLKIKVYKAIKPIPIYAECFNIIFQYFGFYEKVLTTKIITHVKGICIFLFQQHFYIFNILL